MNQRDFRKKVIDFCIEQNKKCTPRANLVGEVKKEKIQTKQLSDKGKNVKRVIDTGCFGCNTRGVTQLMEIILGESLPIDYNHNNSDNNSDLESKFEKYDRKKKFSKYSILECSDLQFQSNYGDETFLIHLNNSYIDNDATECPVESIPEDEFKWLEVATDEATKNFINDINIENLRNIFAFLDLE